MEQFIQIGGGLLVLLLAYQAKGDGFRKMLSKFASKKAQLASSEHTCFDAWQVLMEDAHERSCSDSAKLLIQLMEQRSLHGIKKDGA